MDWLRGVSRELLEPQSALKVAMMHLENARKAIGAPELEVALCLDAYNALLRIRTSDRKTLVSASSSSSGRPDQEELRKNIALTIKEIASKLHTLGRHEHSRNVKKYGRKWGPVPSEEPMFSNRDSSCSSHNNEPTYPPSPTIPATPFPSATPFSTISPATTLVTNRSFPSSFNSISKPMIKETPSAQLSTIQSPLPKYSDIFTMDVAISMKISSLPKADEHLTDIHQLVHCLSLLPSSPLKRGHHLSPEEEEWSLAISKNQEEQERLQNLASDVLEMFMKDKTKAEASVTEVVSLAPVLKKELFRTLLMELINGIDSNVMLHTNLLDGLAQLIQGAPPGHIDPDDLVKILNVLNKRLHQTHNQSSDFIYRLSVAVSRVLDAMANSHVKELDRVHLHEPLKAYMDQLKRSKDIYQVYHAAHAFQALLYIPDNETKAQATLRRTTTVIRGLFGMVSAVKSMNVNDFIDQLGNIQDGLPSIELLLDLSLSVYNSMTSSAEHSTSFMESLRVGFNFSRKATWYPALRGADVLLQTGELFQFKALVHNAPCRHDPAFQWGLCQRLGQIAADTKWDMDTRRDAIVFLGEIYKNDHHWKDYIPTKQWIVTILHKLSALSDNNLLGTNHLLDELAMNGNESKQQLFRDALQSPVSYPLVNTPAPIASPSLLDRVQNKPDVEKRLRQLMNQRLEATTSGGEFYIPQYGKSSLQARDDDKFILMDKTKEFLDNDQKVLLVQGDSGAGKSKFNQTLEHDLWKAYRKKDGKIPLYINLPAIEHPDRDLVSKQLRKYDFEDAEIRELKKSRKFILICDGYDESGQSNNLYVTNRLNQPGEWKVQMVISCRSEYLGADYRDRFQPADRNCRIQTPSFVEAVIVPFSIEQIDDFIKNYVVNAKETRWQFEDYHRAFKLIPSLLELVKNPFLLILALEVLPRMMEPHNIVLNAEIKRISLYDQFIEMWLERNKKRLSESLQWSEERRIFEILSEDGFTQNGIRYLTALAKAIYMYQDGNPVVDYSHFDHKGTWKEKFFSKSKKKNLLREAVPLTRTGNQHRFLHRSILEYCLARAVFEPQAKTSTFVSVDMDANLKQTKAVGLSRQKSFSSCYSFEATGKKKTEHHHHSDPEAPNEASPLVWRSLVNEPSILQFLVDRVRLEPVFKQQLYNYVELSKVDDKWRIAAANAMTILVRAGETFIGADLRGIQIPGADLSRGIFESVRLQGADLRKVSFRNCWLRKADMTGARMDGVQFGEWPSLQEESGAMSAAYSPDGKTFAVGLLDGPISVYETVTWTKLCTWHDRSDAFFFTYSPDSRHIAAWNDDHMVVVRDAASGALVHSMQGHIDRIRCVAYSPDGQYLASAGDDGTVRLWDSQSGLLKYSLEGHTGWTLSLAFSPDSGQLVSASRDSTVRIWDMALGKELKVLEHENETVQVLYSPNNSHEIISRGNDHNVYVWNVCSGELERTLRNEDLVEGIQYSPDGKFVASFASLSVTVWNLQTGVDSYKIHIDADNILDLKYSPSGDQIAICGSDNAVRIWDSRTGRPINTLYGHTPWVYAIAYSPSGHQIASIHNDSTVRLWDSALPWQSSHGSNIHTQPIRSVELSPSGRQVASCSDDGTVRVWDGRTGHHIYMLQGDMQTKYNIKYSPDDRFLASCDNKQGLRLWDSKTGQFIRTFEPLVEQNGFIMALDFSPVSGHQIVGGHSGGSVILWNTHTGAHIHTFQESSYAAWCVMFSPKGEQVLSCDRTGKVNVWDLQSKDLVWSAMGNLASMALRTAMVYSPDSSKVAFVHSDDKLGLWDAETGLIYQNVDLQGLVQLSSAFSPCGQQLALGCKDGATGVIDTESGRYLLSLQGHTGDVLAISYSPDGQYIASGSKDRTVRLWDPRSGENLATIDHVGGIIRTLTWNITTEGYFLVTGCDDSSVRKWQIVNEKGEASSNGDLDERQYHLKWSTGRTVLYVDKACIQGVTGLGDANKKLLKERCVVGNPSERLNIQEVSKKFLKAATAAATTSKKSFSASNKYNRPRSKSRPKSTEFNRFSMSNVTHMTNMSSMSFKENRTVSAIVETDSSDINYDHKHNDSPDHNHNHNHNISQSKADNSSTALSHINHNHSYNADHNGNSNNSNSNNNSSNSSIARNHVSHNHDHSHNFNSSKGQILISWGDSPNSGLRLSCTTCSFVQTFQCSCNGCKQPKEE